jgi:hypothetical protein
MARETRVLGWRLVAGVTLALASLALAPEKGSADPEEVAIVSLTPAVQDSILVCGVTTRGLPDLPSRETLLSGLPSALVLGFSVFDDTGHIMGATRAEIRIEPDLWEEIFLVRTPNTDHRLKTLRDVESLLAHVNPIPILPLAKLRADLPYQVRVRLAVHPLAPSEIQRSRDIVAGEPAGLGDPNRREFSVGLNSLFRFFLGKADDEKWVSEVTSAPFTTGALSRIAAPLPGAGEN